MSETTLSNPEQEREQLLQESREAWRQTIAKRREQQQEIADQAHEQVLAEMQREQQPQQ